MRKKSNSEVRVFAYDSFHGAMLLRGSTERPRDSYSYSSTRYKSVVSYHKHDGRRLPRGRTRFCDDAILNPFTTAKIPHINSKYFDPKKRRGLLDMGNLPRLIRGLFERMRRFGSCSGCVSRIKYLKL